MPRISFISLFFLLFSLNGRCDLAEEIPEIKKATVFIRVEQKIPFSDSPSVSSGSGFFINDKGLVATNYHVIRDWVTSYGVPFPAPVTGIEVVTNSGGEDFEKFQARVVAVDKEHDLALLKVDHASESYLDVVADEEKDLVETMKVHVFGYPFGDSFSVLQRGPEVTISGGAISALRHNSLGELVSIQMDATVNPGNSGGPLVNEEGKVLGVVNMKAGESSMSFAVPAHYLEELQREVLFNNLGKDRIEVTLRSNPSGVWVRKGDSILGKTPVKFWMEGGWDRYVLMKKGYAMNVEEHTLLSDTTMNLWLPVLKERVLTPMEVNGSEKESRQDFRFPLKNGKVLFKEGFDEKQKFKEWEQVTGGVDKRSWYLEDGNLRQFNVDGTLHAIYLGDSSWRNISVTTRVKLPHQGTGDNRAGLIFRENQDGFYLFRIHRESNKAQLAYHSKHPFGWNIIRDKELNVDLEKDQWYELTVMAKEDRLVCYLDSLLVFNLENDLSTKGRIGFYSVESKPSFSEVEVQKLRDTLPSISREALRDGLSSQSFWFSERFDLNSKWLYQYVESPDTSYPWYHSEAGAGIFKPREAFHYIETTKFLVKDFMANFVFSVHEPQDSARFRVYFRKDEENRARLEYSRSDSTLVLFVEQKGEWKELKRTDTDGDMFKGISNLQMLAHEDKFEILENDEPIFEYQGEELPQHPGRMGFGVSNSGVVLHKLMVTSVREEE